MSRLDELLTADEVAELLHIPSSTVSDYARRGVLPSIKLGRHRRFVRSDVADAIEGLRVGACSPALQWLEGISVIGEAAGRAGGSAVLAPDETPDGTPECLSGVGPGPGCPCKCTLCPRRSA